MQLKCDGKQHKCNVCEKLFNSYSVMIFYKRVHFGERSYKFFDCREQFIKMILLCIQFEDLLYNPQTTKFKCCDSDNFTDNFSSSQEHIEGFPSCQEYMKKSNQAIKRMAFYKL